MTLQTERPHGLTTRIWEMIFPEYANHYGTLFGGTALRLASKAAFIAAIRHARGAVVMAKCEQVEFDQPVAVGQLLELVSYVSREGRSSMTVEVEVIRETPATGERTPVIKGRFEMVAVDGQGNPSPLHS